MRQGIQVKKFFKYFFIALVAFLSVRLMDRENPLIGEPIDDRTDLEFIAEYQPESRPEALPDNAVWRGGIDGGYYFVLPTPLENDNLYYAEIYLEGSGALLYKGPFKYIYPENSTGEPIDPTRTDINMWFDGERLYLGKSNQHLVPMGDYEKD